jgi:hypothetical protein
VNTVIYTSFHMRRVIRIVNEISASVDGFLSALVMSVASLLMTRTLTRGVALSVHLRNELHIGPQSVEMAE